MMAAPSPQTTPSMTSSTTESTRDIESPLTEEKSWLQAGRLPAAIHRPPFECETVGSASVFDAEPKREVFVSDIAGQFDSMELDNTDADWTSFTSFANSIRSKRNTGPWNADDVTSKDSNSTYGLEKQMGLKLPVPRFRQPLHLIEVASEFTKQGHSPRAMDIYLKRNKTVLEVDPTIFFRGAVEAVERFEVVEFAGCINCMNVVRAHRFLTNIAGSFRDFIKALIANEDDKANERQTQIARTFWTSCGAFIAHISGMRTMQYAQRASIPLDDYPASHVMASLPGPILLEEHQKHEDNPR